MRVPASAYAVLGLQPGADRAAVEEAYRRLIKLHHPDRSGGDAARAAEINRAYFELRRQQGIAEDPTPQVVVRAPSRARTRIRRRRRRSRLWSLLILAVAGFLVIDGERMLKQTPRWIAWLSDLRPSAPSAGRGSVARVDSTALDGPLNDAVISGSIRQATALASRGEEELAHHSRACHRGLRLNPDLAQLDRCAAFDDAVVALADRGPMTDSGAFNASAVTARQMTAARLLSSDYLAIERRLDRIRMRVELALTPRAPLPQPPQNAVHDDPQLSPEPVVDEVLNGA